MPQTIQDNIDLNIKFLTTRLGRAKVALLGDSVIEDFAAMTASLIPEIILPILSNLNHILHQELKTKDFLIEHEDGSFEIKRKNPSYVSHYKVLTNFILKWALDNGFNQGGELFVIRKDLEGNRDRILISLPQTLPTTIYGFIPPHIFRNVFLSSGYVFKDVAAGNPHGEFSHFLALYVLVEENKRKPFLKHTPLYLYKLLGSSHCLWFEDGDLMSVWDFMFDRLTKFKTFNSPEYLHKYVRKANTSLPILAELLKGRFIKRSSEQHAKNMIFKLYKSTEVLEANTLVLNGGLFFRINTPSQLFKGRIIPDTILTECRYDEKLKHKYPLPEIDPQLSIIDRIIYLFNPKNFSDSHQESKPHAKLIYELLKFLRIKHPQISHRKILNCFDNYFLQENTYRKVSINEEAKNDEYIQFLINEAKGMLIAHDEAELAQNKPLALRTLPQF